MPDTHKMEYDEENKTLIITQIGEISIENNRKVLPGLLAQKSKHKIRKFLFDQRNTITKTTPSEFIKFFKELKSKGIGKNDAIVGITDHLESMQAMAGIIANNLGMNAYFFDEMEEAKRWLRTQ